MTWSERELARNSAWATPGAPSVIDNIGIVCRQQVRSELPTAAWIPEARSVAFCMSKSR